MADTAVVHIGENSPEEVAFKLLRLIGRAEKKSLEASPVAADRQWILKTYAMCLETVREPHQVEAFLNTHVVK
jgi:hypothetical protein